MRRLLCTLAMVTVALLTAAAPAMASTPAMPDGVRGGDPRSDFVVVRAEAEPLAPLWTWYWGRAYDGGHVAPNRSSGVAYSMPVPADYLGRGYVQEATWRSDGCFNFAAECTFWGEEGDDPTVVADYDGDGRADFAVYRAGSPSVWYVHGSTGRDIVAAWGEADDYPAPGDYDGDGRADFAVQRTSPDGTTYFWILGSSSGFKLVHWGNDGDAVVPGDFDGDGRTDIAVTRDVDGVLTWYVLGSSGHVAAWRFGDSATDLETPGDYDGDGATDIAVWRTGSPGRFWVQQSSDLALRTLDWGQTDDFPVANIWVH